MAVRPLLVLLHHGRLERPAFDGALASSPRARLGAAETLASWLNHGDTAATDRMKRLAVDFANDDDPDVRQAILAAFLGRGESPLLDDRSFLTDIVHSKAIGDDKEMLLHAFDRRGTLLPLEKEVRDFAHRLVTDAPADADPWRNRHQADKCCEMLSRLIEEAEREEKLDVRDAALDAWDELLRHDVPAALSSLSTRLGGA